MISVKANARNLRKGRHSQSGHFYFLTTTVAGRRRIFTRPDRANIVLDAIRWIQAERRFIVDAAVVTPDHLHLVGQLGKSTLTAVMHTLKSYSSNCLARTGVATPVWQAGFHDHGLRDDEDYKVRIQYVVRNPQRAGLVRRVKEYPHIILPDWWCDADDLPADRR